MSGEDPRPAAGDSGRITRRLAAVRAAAGAARDRVATRSTALIVLELLGVSEVVHGIGLIYRPAAYIVAGAAFVAIGELQPGKKR